MVFDTYNGLHTLVDPWWAYWAHSAIWVKTCKGLSLNKTSRMSHFISYLEKHHVIHLIHINDHHIHIYLHIKLFLKILLLSIFPDLKPKTRVSCIGSG